MPIRTNEDATIRLNRLIRANEVPGWAEVDWLALYQEHLKRLKRRVKSGRVRKPVTTHRFHHRALTANARAKKWNAEGRLTPEDLDMVMARCQNRCQRCGATKHLVFDHIVSFYQGGTNYPDNLQVLCRICNMLKGVR